jgi:hypothetical protein
LRGLKRENLPAAEEVSMEFDPLHPEGEAEMFVLGSIALRDPK